VLKIKIILHGNLKSQVSGTVTEKFGITLVVVIQYHFGI
jgi:hypothetical protein